MTTEQFVKEKLEEGLSETEIRRAIRDVFSVKKSQGNRLFRRAMEFLKSGGFPALENGVKEEISLNYEGPAGDLEEFILGTGVDTGKYEVERFNVKDSARGNQFSVYFKPKAGAGFDKESFLSSINSPVEHKKVYPRNNDGLLAELNQNDLHLGKYCSLDETGNVYNLEEAKKVFNQAIDYNIRELKKHQIDKIILPLAGDFYHFDNQRFTTTAGTPQDCDGKYFQMFREGVKLIRSAIEKLKEVAPVELITIRGNHDEQSIVLLGEVLSAVYENDENVTVTSSLLPRHYVQFGKNLICYCHGNGLKMQNIPLIMAQEASEKWGTSTFKYARLGHLHHSKMFLEEYSGVIVEVTPSLSGTDKWHKDRAFFGSIRSTMTALYDKNHGLISKIFFNL